MSYARQHDNGQFVAVSTKAKSEADRAKSTSEVAERMQRMITSQDRRKAFSVIEGG